MSRRKCWSQKPPVGTQINWGHPLSKNLVGCWLINEKSGNYSSNLVLLDKSSISSMTWDGSSPYGIGIKGAGSGSVSVTSSLAGSPYMAGTWNAASVIVGLYPTTNCASAGLFTQSSEGIIVNVQASGYLQVGYRGSGGTYYRITSSTVYVDPNMYQVYGFTAKVTNSTMKLYENGAFIESGGTGQAFRTITSTFDIFKNITGYGLYCFYYKRELQSNEISSLYSNPYQFLSPIKRCTFIYAEGAPTAVSYTSRLWLGGRISVKENTKLSLIGSN